MASRHDIIHIDFEANAGKVSPALKAIQNSATDTRKAVEGAKQALADLEKAGAGDTVIEAQRKKVKALERDVKSLEQAGREYVKGIGTLDKAIKAFNEGTLEQMSAAFQKASYNAAKLAKTKLVPSDKDYGKTMEELSALMQRNEEYMAKSKLRTDELISTIKQGGKVANTELTQEMQNLRELLDVIPKGTAEWKQYNDQLTKIKDHVQTLSETERRLAGEIVTVADAMKMANASTREAAEQRLKDAAAAKQQAETERATLETQREASRLKIETAEKEAASIKEQITEQEKLVKSQEALYEASDRADKEVDEARKKRDAARESTKQYTDAITTAANKVADLKKQLEALNGTPVKPQVDTSELDRLKAAYEKAADEMAGIESSWDDKMRNYIFEKYPTQATVSAKTRSPEGLKEREAMKADPELARMREQSQKELNAADQRLSEALRPLMKAEEELNALRSQSTQTTQSSVDADKKKAEVTKQLADAQAELDKATKDAEEPKKKLEKAEKDYSDALERQAKAYDDLDASRGKQDFAGQNEKLDQLQRNYDELTVSIEKEKQALTENATAAKEAYDKETEAAIDMAQAQNYSQKSLEDSIALLEKQNKVETDPEKYKEQATAIDTMQQRIKEMTGEWMSYADAEKFAESIGTDGFIATSDQLQKATQSLTRYRDTLIKTIQQKREDGAATAEEEAELKKVEAELKKMKFEMDNANMSSKRMHEILKDPSSAKNLDELSAAIKRSTQELKLMEETIGKDNAKYKEMAEQTKKATIAQKEMEAQFKASAGTFEKAWSRLKTYIGLYVGAAVAMQKVVATMGDLMELSDKMGEVRKTTGFTADEVGRLSTALANMDTRTSLTGLMELSAVAGQLGLKTEQDVQGFTEAANMLMVALPEMGKEGATAMLKVALATGEIDKIRQQMQDGLIEGGDAVSVAMTKIGSTIDSLRANSAAAAPAITDFVKRVGAVGAQSGITIDQVAALGSTVDALGMRVEMSATALSRMIPAIRNNAFEIGKTIGLSQERIEEMYKEGRAMEVIIMLLEKMRGMTAEDIESKLSTGGMADVLKDLNQQGARAGIVFAGLSQNVDELKRQLGVAKTAYEENIAIQNEYNKMNETTAAKWARLKNQLEELFIGDVAQRWLGGVIDRLRQLLDLAIKYEAYVKSFITYLVLLRMGIGELITVKFTGWLVTVLNGFGSFITGLRGMVAGTTSLKTAWSGLTKAMNANVFVAVASALAMLAHQLWDVHNEAKQAALEMERVLEQTNEERVAVEKLFKPLRDANLQEEEKRKLIAAINNQYGTYLSKMLSEASNAQEIARAYEAINLQLQKKNILEGIEANNRRIRDKAQGDLNDSAKDLRERIGMSAPKSNIPEIREAIMDVIKEFETTNILATDPNNPKRYAKDYTRWDTRITGVLRELWQEGKFDKDITEADFSNIKRQALDYWKELYGVQKKQTDANQYLQDELDYIIGKARTAANKDIPELISDFDKAIGKHDGNVKNYSADESKAVITAFDAIKAYYELHKDELNQEQLKKINKKLETSVDEFRKKAAAAGGGGGKGRTTNPYGNAPAADSTEYSTWNVEELVFRRKQMDKYKNVLKPGVEVREVLSQDKALMKALDNGLKDDWQSVLGWYNQERLKIQKELKSERISTNEGHWLDEKNGKGRKNKLAESDYALAELDRYYLRRKQAMEKARSEEKITEEMYNRQVELLEQEHLKKRSDLRGTFTGELGKKETEQFRKWWKGLEKQYELDDVSWKTVESEWSKATAAQIGRNNQRMQKDLTDQQAIVMKHMNTIAGIIAQERPYDGITKNLQDNLTKIDVLFADFGVIPNEQIENGSLFEENSKRLAFLLGEAERAYTLTAEELTADMRKAGFDAWADALDEQAKQRLLAQLQSTYDKIQEAIKKEAAQIKKEVDIWWSDIATGEKQSRKDTFEKALSNLGLLEDGVKRANSLIGTGVASERVADKLAIKQMQIRLAMQATYFAKMREVGELEIRRLQEAGKLQDAEHLRKSLNLALTQEQVKLDEQRVAIANKLEESQNRLYTQMHEYADLLYSSMQSLFEASNTGNAEFYNERAKLQLTGGDGTAKQYIVIDNAGTEDAEAHYEYLTEMEALERQHEIDQQNASAEAWRKVMDDVNAKINEMITDQLNAMLQDAAINDNTAATNANTEALIALTSSIGGGKDGDMPGIDTTFGSGLNLGDIMSGSDNGSGSDKDKKPTPSIEIGPLNRLDFDDYDTSSQGSGGNNPSYLYDWSGNSGSGSSDWAAWRIEQNNAFTANAIENAGKRQEAETKADKKMTATAQSAFAKMTQAANLYGIAYQVMSNDNMTAAQKFGMIAVQAAGNAAITALTVNMSETAAKTASDTPSVFSELWKQLGWGAIPVFALFTGLLGGLMGLAASAITKSKSQIAQATGVSASQGRLATGMLTYAEGNVNEFTDPGSLTPGRHYNVDAADGKSYRAKYMGTNPKTHITNGPEFHLAGEAGREAIIDAHTTRLLQMDDNGIWSAIQTLYNGGSLRHSSRRGRGVRAFASGNLEELEEMDNGQWTMDNGMDNGMDIAAMTDALNRQTAVQEALLERLSSPIQATFNVYGKGGLVDSYDTGKKTVNRHGVKY